MDKKNLTIGVVLLLSAFAILMFGPKSPPPTTTPASEKGPATSTAPGATPGPAQPAAPLPDGANAALAAARDAADATVTTLRNDFIEARFTNSGGALRDVAFVKRDEKGKLIYPDRIGGNDAFVFNALHADPMLAFVENPALDRNARYELVSSSATEVVYRTVLDGKLEVTRRYTISPNQGEGTDPYLIGHETTLRNLGEETRQATHLRLSVGTAAPVNVDDPALQLATGYSAGGDRHFTPRTELEPGGGFLGMGAHAARSVTSTGNLAWSAVKNQFFTSIFTSEKPANALISRRVKLFPTMADEAPNAYGITGVAQFDVPALGGKQETKIAGRLYVGPKEYSRLANSTVFKADEDKVMDFGMFRFFSQILLTLMTWIHGLTNNWGIAIILTTLTLKTLFVPLTLSASKSAKRMAKLQPEMQAIREKHKDNPQKQQQATMELFKSRKINPLGGCFPILVTIPFFIGFFQMLQSTAELRFQPFLWAPDLSSTDTVAVLFGLLPLRIMPLLMGATMVIQMHLTPSPSVDNMQMKMMKFMPYIFTLFCYNFSCALSLYSFVNGLFTIGQQLVINRMKDPEEKPGAKPTDKGPAGRPIKNVTPPKKKG